MPSTVDDQVIDFYYDLFDHIFSAPFRAAIPQRRKRNTVIRQVEEAADAASQSLSRFFQNEQLSELEVAELLEHLADIAELLTLKDISRANVTPEAVVDDLLQKLSGLKTGERQRRAAIYRLALHSTVQGLMLVGPVMAEWQKLNFSTTFELPRRVVNRLNQISEQLDALGRSGQAAADERYELTYRDYLMQRFYRVEAGTVRMTTNMDVDLGELFVMPRVWAHTGWLGDGDDECSEFGALMNLAAARRTFSQSGQNSGGGEGDLDDRETGLSALEQVKARPRNVIIGPPGSGKSTFLEWLQVKLASREEVLLLSGQQAIPLLLRVRQLDPYDLPRGEALIEKATASKDRAALMPAGWLERQMKAGRILFMIDGLDETEPDWRDQHLLPWLDELCREYPDCHFLISSRPVGYPLGRLHGLDFVECELLDFNQEQIEIYTHNWSTAIRLAQNEPEEEARREGAEDGIRIVDSFQDHAHISNLARNPLMLSAICLVNYFEGGQLPQDRARLYQLCVEGLLHNWDQRRGIRSEFALSEKLRVCREVALAMQTDDRAEYETEKVRQIFTDVLADADRAADLLEHIRYRTGLLLERRSNTFAFAYLTFQEYLAAQAIYEGNHLGLDIEGVIEHHSDGRWIEVIALYCGSVPTPTAHQAIEHLIVHPDTASLSTVLRVAYLSSNQAFLEDQALRKRVIRRIAIAPYDTPGNLDIFPRAEVAPIAYDCLGKIETDISLSETLLWLADNADLLDVAMIFSRFQQWPEMKAHQISEYVLLLHTFGSEDILAEMARDSSLYLAPGPVYSETEDKYETQAEVALIGLSVRNYMVQPIGTQTLDLVLLQILRAVTQQASIQNLHSDANVRSLFEYRLKLGLPQDAQIWPEYASLARQLSKRLLEEIDDQNSTAEGNINVLDAWADYLEQAIAE